MLAPEGCVDGDEHGRGTEQRLARVRFWQYGSKAKRANWQPELSLLHTLLVAVRGAATTSRLRMPRAVEPATGHRAGLARVLLRTPRVFLSMSSFMPWRLLATVLIRGKYSGLCHHQPPRHATNV